MEPPPHRPPTSLRTGAENLTPRPRHVEDRPAQPGAPLRASAEAVVYLQHRSLEAIARTTRRSNQQLPGWRRCRRHGWGPPHLCGLRKGLPTPRPGLRSLGLSLPRLRRSFQASPGEYRALEGSTTRRDRRRATWHEERKPTLSDPPRGRVTILLLFTRVSPIGRSTQPDRLPPSGRSRPART